MSTAKSKGRSIENSLMGLELRQILRPLLRWWWALLIVPALCGGIAFYLIQRSPTYYQARTLLNVGPDPAFIPGELPELTIIRLGHSYAKIAQEDQFIQEVIKEAKSPLSVQDIKQATVVFYVGGSQLFGIQTVDSDSERALTLLNTMNKLLQSRTPETDKILRESERKFQSTRLTELKTALDANKTALRKINDELQSLSNSNSVGDLTLVAQAYDIKDKLNRFELEYRELDGFVNGIDPNLFRVVADPWLVDVELGPQPRNAAVAMGTVSLTLLLIFIYWLEKLDSRVRTALQAEKLLGQKVIMALPNGKRKRFFKGRQVYPLDAALCYDLLATELTSNYDPQTGNHRVLIVHEQYSVGVEGLLNGLAEALAREGIQAQVVESLAARALITASSPAAIAARSGGGGAVALQEAPDLEWNLINQNWPSNEEYLRYLNGECAEVLVVCSLKRSRRRNLSKLHAFLEANNSNVMGLVLS